VLRGCICY